MGTLEELKSRLGRPLSHFCELRELRVFRLLGADGYMDPAVDVTLATDDSPEVVLSLRAHGVREFHAVFDGRPLQVMGFDIESIRDRQMEGLNWKVLDYEDDRMGFLCREFEILALR